MSARDELAAALRPLVTRMCRSHKWVKGKNGPRHVDEPFSEVSLSEHVMRGSAYGLCPIVPGESTTRTACLDLDSHKGETPLAEMRAIAEQIAVTLEADGHAPVLFTSSGGQGIHIYLVWDEPQDAYSVREMLRAALNANGFKPGTAGVADREIEVFPKQNEVPHDGQGSMFILPFAGQSEPLGTFAGWPASCPVLHVERPPEPERIVSINTPELARIASALAAIPNTGTEELSYDDWRNIVFSIHYATDGSDEGLALAHEFSARSSKYDSDFLDGRVWPYIRGERGGAVVTERSLFAAAAERGWVDEAIADEFEVLEEEHNEQPEQEVPMFTAVRAVDFAAGRPLEWIIKNVLPRADVGMIFGGPGAGKTFLILDMAGSIVRGVDWRDRPVKKGRVCYVVAEGAPGFRKRIEAYCLHNQLDIADLDLYVIADAPNLTEKAHVAALIASLKVAGPFDLIVLDTLAGVSEGADENSAQDMGRVLGRARAIGKAAGAMVLIVHHSGKDGARGARGSTALKGRVDVEIEVVRCDADRVATISKLRDQEDQAEFGFKLLTIPVTMDEAGDVVSSCVVEHGAAKVNDRRKGELKGDVEKVVYQTVTEMLGLDGGSPSSNEVIEAAVGHLAQDSTKRDTRRQRVMRALDALHARGRVVIADGKVGVPSGD